MNAIIDFKSAHVPRFTIGEWQVDADQCRISRDGKLTRLEPKVMEALVYLASRAGETVTREELEENVWAGTIVGYYSLTGTMQKLRKAFDDDSKNPRVIETLSKRGYRLIADINILSESRQAKRVDLPSPSESMSASATISSGTHHKKFALSKQLYIVLGLFVVLTTTYLLVSNSPVENNAASDPASSRSVQLAVGIPSVAVLPFENQSDDKSNDYFVDGITNDIITDLTKVAGLLVIARDSTFEYKNSAVDLQEVAKRLNAKYILHGNMRRANDKVRINAFLVDTGTNSQLWAERYDGEVTNIFELQDRISSNIVAALKVKLSSQESQNLNYKYTNNIAAYELFLKGRETAYQYSKASTFDAQILLQQAIELDPNFGEAYALLGWTYAYTMMNGWGDDRKVLHKKALDLANKALALHDQIPMAYFTRGLIYRDQKLYDKALKEAEKVIAIDPSYANGHVLLATLMYYAGRAEDGLARMKYAARLNPHHPHNYPFHMGQAYFVLKRYDEAIAAFEKGLETRPRSQRIHIWLAAAYAQSGRIDDAKWEVEQILLLDPDFDYNKLHEIFPFKDPKDQQHFLDGLRKAGLQV